MGNDRERWDERHGRGGPLPPPDPFVLEALDLLGPGDGRRALDLAGGRGRHARELLERGWAVELVDVSPVALDRAREELGPALVRTELDLSGEAGAQRALGLGPADLVLVVDFLERPLLRLAHRLLVPGGSLLACTFTTEREGEHPSARFCLEPGELPGLVANGVPRLQREGGGRAGVLVEV